MLHVASSALAYTGTSAQIAAALGLIERSREFVTGYLPVMESGNSICENWIAGVLRAIAVEQHRLGIDPSDSPALLFGPDGKLVEFSVAARAAYPDAAHFSVTDCLRKATTALGCPDLAGLNHRLYVIGESNSIAGSGAIYQFAPGRVVVVQPPAELAGKIHGFPLRHDYWQEALRHRGVRLTRHDEHLSIVDAKRFPEAKLTDLKLPQVIDHGTPDIVQEFLEGHELKVFKTVEGKLDPSDSAVIELMGSLHYLAEASVNSGGGPFASVVIDPKSGRIISAGVNRVVPWSDASAHGERTACRLALKVLFGEEPVEGVADLSGYIIVTSSITCIGCGEAVAKLRIGQMVYDNDAEEVERLTRTSRTPGFSEGPLDHGIFGQVGLVETRLVFPDNERRHAAFAAYRQVVEGDPSRAYLKKLDDGKK